MDNRPTNDPPGQQQLHDITTRTARKLSEVIGNSQDVLFSANTVFPFVLFPDTVTVDREKVTVAHRTFFRVAEIVSVPIEDVLNVTADVGPFFGSIVIQTRFFDNHANINFLKRHDALKLKRVLQGYVVATKKSIDCSTFSASQLAEILDNLGKGHPTMTDM